MLHSKHITIPANTTANNPLVTQFIVNKGVIASAWLGFPSGCVGLVRTRVYHQGHPFLPVDADAYISGDNFTFVYAPMVEILESPELITVEAWNLDDTYSHTVDLQILIIDKMWVQPVGAYEGIVAALSSIFRKEARK